MRKFNYKYILNFIFIAAIGMLIVLSDTKVLHIIVESFDEVLLFPRGFTEIPFSNFKNITVSSALIGCVVLGLFGGFVSQKIGRKVK